MPNLQGYPIAKFWCRSPESNGRWLLLASTIPFRACCLQYKGFSLSLALNVGHVVHDECEKRFLYNKSTMLSAACSLQYTGVLLPGVLMLGRFKRESCKQRLVCTSTMPSSACCLQ